MKECNTCHELKFTTEFHKNNRTKDKLAAKCKSCLREYLKTYVRRPESPEDIFRQRMRRHFNITPERYYEILEQQNYRCAICKRHVDEFTRRLAVDHDHGCCPGDRSCGKCVRGLLCTACNTDVGRIEGGRLPLEELVAYVQKFAV